MFPPSNMMPSKMPPGAVRNLDASSAPVEAGQFDGDWINTSASPQGWHALQTSYLEGVPAIRARLKDGTVVEFSGITLYGGIGSNDLAAFRAEHVGKGSRILLQGNLNLGLLVLATFKIPTAGGIGFFSREFFARSRLAAPGMAASGDSDALFEQFNTPEASGGQAWLGRWHNADSQTRGLLEITLEETGHGITARALGTPVSGGDPPIDWGHADTQVIACLDEAGQPSLAALATWKFDNLVTELQLRISGGTMVVAGFNEFRDGRMNYATREFFFRVSG